MIGNILPGILIIVALILIAIARELYLKWCETRRVITLAEKMENDIHFRPTTAADQRVSDRIKQEIKEYYELPWWKQIFWK